MGQILFANFLDDKRVYHLAQLFWSRYVQKVAESHDIDFRKYLNTSNDFDGNPIFNAYFPSFKKTIRIIQVDPAEASDELDLKSWIDESPIGDSEEEIQELVIDTVLSEGSKNLGKELIYKWLSGEIVDDSDIRLVLLGSPRG